MKITLLLCVILAACTFGFAKEKADVRDITGCLSKGEKPLSQSRPPRTSDAALKADSISYQRSLVLCLTNNFTN